MPAAAKKEKKPQQRIRLTNKAIESRQFSSVPLPRTNEAGAHKVNVDQMHAELSGAATSSATDAHGGTSSSFDPIINDPMFVIVQNSSYWPPPTLAELQRSSGVELADGDGFDQYDRRDDDQQAKRERTAVVKGELNHPRGKARANTITKLEDSSNDDDDDEEEEDS